MGIRRSRRRRSLVRKAATATGRICTIAMSSPCRTNGSIPGTPPGILPSTCSPLRRVDPAFAKEQLVLFLREWYMHPNGQLPAYEWALSDVNPPCMPGPAWRVYKITAARGCRDRQFLARVFQKLLINFTWWVNRKDIHGNHLFSGGFLGLDNIGIFDRSQPLPNGGNLEQADGTAWMAFYSATMLSMALELAREEPVYEDVASKFFEHFVAIADAMNTLGGAGLWHEEDGFYYDRLHTDGQVNLARIRSLVGLIPLIAVEVLEDEVLESLPGFRKRLNWFLENRQDLAQHISYVQSEGACRGGRRLLAIPSAIGSNVCCVICLTKTSFSLPLAFVPFRDTTGSIRTSARSGAGRTGSPTCRATPIRACSAETRIGAGQSGFR